ncbi:hypothetical protein ONJ45_27430, partial [Salmonella enterica subsp. enterica serovar Virginia]|nr:hypothetical protein [Salmonella enterica subsp. enterica serovar Virginia]
AKIGFLAIANKFQAMIDSGNIPPQYTESQLAQLVFNNRLDAGHDKAVCETWRYIYPYFAADTGGIRLEKTFQFIQVTQQIFCP